MRKYASEDEEELRTGRLYPEPTALSQHYFRGGATFMEENKPEQEGVQARTATLHEINSRITDMNRKLTSIHKTLHSNPPSHSFLWPLLLFLGCLCFIVALTVSHYKNLYHELRIQPTASQAELTQAFSQWTLRNHPNKFPKAKQAEQSAYFFTMSTAFEVLIEAEIRKSYDLSFAFQLLKTMLELLQIFSFNTITWDKYGLLLCLSLMLSFLFKFLIWSTFLLYQWLHKLGGGWLPKDLTWLLAAALPLYGWYLLRVLLSGPILVLYFGLPWIILVDLHLL